MTTSAKPSNQDLQAKIDAQADSIEHIKFVYQASQSSLQQFFSRISLVASLVVAVFGVGTIVQALYQSDRISDSIRRNEENETKRDLKLDEYFKLKSIKSVSITNALDESDALYGTGDLTVQTIGDRVASYTLALVFTARFSFEGSTTANLNSYVVRYSSQFVEKFFEVSDDMTARKAIAGETYINNINVVSGQKYSVSFSTTITKKSCQEVMNILDRMLSEKDLGTITISPIYEVTNQISSSRDFIPKLIKPTFSLTCDDLERFR